MLNNNMWTAVEFTQSARRHKIGRARVLQVIAHPVAILHVPREGPQSERWLVLGVDDTGRELEVILVIESRTAVVIHAMDLREKFRSYFEEGLK